MGTDSTSRTPALPVLYCPVCDRQHTATAEGIAARRAARIARHEELADLIADEDSTDSDRERADIERADLRESDSADLDTLLAILAAEVTR